jgi:heme/copper-type cytochrome/quinol oxidase subunit 2
MHVLNVAASDTQPTPNQPTTNMIIEILLIVIPALIASFVIGFFYGCAIENNRHLEEDASWDLPPIDEPILYRICDNHAGRAEIVKGGSDD